MLTSIFELHGRFCATHPLEVIVATFTLTACMLNMETGIGRANEKGLSGAMYCTHNKCNTTQVLKAADIVLMTIIRCLAVLFTYYHFRNLQRMGSKYILGIAGLFSVFSSVVFTTSVVNFSRSDAADLKDALFFFLLLIDLSKAATLAQCAMNSRNQEEVKANIARGMSLLGPTITLDTLVETLLISIGSLSGVRRLEILCTIACLGVIVNYIVFMTFYPACLSLILELSRNNNMGRLGADRIFIMQSLNEEDQKPNPVVERVKMIMIGGLFLVHANSRWSLKAEKGEYMAEMTTTSANSNVVLNGSDHNENSTEDESLMSWLLPSAEYVVILILLLALTIKFIFCEDRSDMVARRLRFQQEEREATAEEREATAEEREATAEEREIRDGPNSPDTTTLNMSLQERFGIPTLSTIQQPIFPLSGVGGGWTEIDNDTNVECIDREMQTDLTYHNVNESIDENDLLLQRFKVPRSIEDCLEIYKSELGAKELTDEEVIQLVNLKHIPAYQLEKAVEDPERGIHIRRLTVSAVGKFTKEMDDLPYKNYDYNKVRDTCCENVIGYLPVPVGIVGPLLIDGQRYYVPMATTEGCLVASTNRGCRALIECGVISRIVADGMTRGPVVRFPSMARASEAMLWMKQSENFEEMKRSFDQTSRFARLTKVHPLIAGRLLFIRFVAKTGDAMGMNMLSKGTEKTLHMVQTHFPDMEIIALSGNFCTDKKPAAVNWIEGRGKSVVCEATIPAHIVTNVLKTSVRSMIDVNSNKNMVGSAVAGSIGGFNAQAANVVTAIYIATGQDPAQNVSSSNCMTLMEASGPEGQDLHITCTMPSIEVGTVGGGTGLPAQGACLAMLGVKGAHVEKPGENARKLARIICATVLAGELSLIAALAAGHLVRSHLKYNRSNVHINDSMTTAHSNNNDVRSSVTIHRNDNGVRLTVPSVLSSSQDLCTDFTHKS